MPALAMNETRPIYGRARMYAPHGLGNQLALRRNNIGKLSVLTGGQLRSLDYSFLRDADGLHGDAATSLMTPQPKPAQASPQVEELKQTVSLINEKELNEVLDHIQNAGTVQLVAVGNTIPVALDGAFKLNEIGIRAAAGTIWETQLAFSLTLKPGDVMIAISNSGESRQVVKMVREAKKSGVTTIGITNNPRSAIGSSVDYHIQTATREKLFLNEFCFSRVSAMTVMEILYLFLTVGQEKSYDRMSRCEGLIADEKV